IQAQALTNVADWEKESTARQLAALLAIKENREARGAPKVTAIGRAVLQHFLGENVAALESGERGKVGLALSGGGFRASLFHIGVLARLAELDLLRHVEVLSCLSGGSIIGALYYLKVRKLLEGRPDNEITRQDYIRLVDDMEKAFTADIKHNP